MESVSEDQNTALYYGNLKITIELSEFAAKTTYNSISAELSQTLKLFLLDHIGVAAYGAIHTESAPSFFRAIELLRGDQHGSSTVFTRGSQYQSQYAALLNGALAHSLDFDDTYAPGFLHPGVSTIPAALTEAHSITGKQLLTAMAIGYEITCRIGRALGSGSYARGFHNTSVAGIFGAVATIGHLRGMNAEGIALGFGIAGSKAAGSMQFFESGSWNKRLHPGFAAHDALMCLAFAEAGVQASIEPIEGRNGLLHGYSNTSSTEGLVDDLGKEWILESTAIKPYPGCRATHGTIDLALKMRSNVKFCGGVQKLTLSMSPVAFQLVGRPDHNKIHPANIVDGQFSSYFQLAGNWIFGSSGWALYDQLNNRDLFELSERITIESDPELKSLGTRLSVIWTDGTVTTEEVMDPTGEPSNPITADRVEEKYISLAVPVYGGEKAKRIRNIVMQIEGQTDLRELLELIQ